MITPAIGKKSEELTQEEREERYGIRSLADLRRDMNGLWSWRATALTEKNRMDKAMLSLQAWNDWATGLSLLAVFMAATDLALLCYLSWR
jgi:hypothetical protein